MGVHPVERSHAPLSGLHLLCCSLLTSLRDRLKENVWETERRKWAEWHRPQTGSRFNHSVKLGWWNQNNWRYDGEAALKWPSMSEQVTFHGRSSFWGGSWRMGAEFILKGHHRVSLFVRRCERSRFCIGVPLKRVESSFFSWQLFCGPRRSGVGRRGMADGSPNRAGSALTLMDLLSCSAARCCAPLPGSDHVARGWCFPLCGFQGVSMAALPSPWSHFVAFWAWRAVRQNNPFVAVKTWPLRSTVTQLLKSFTHLTSFLSKMLDAVQQEAEAVPWGPPEKTPLFAKPCLILKKWFLVKPLSKIQLSKVIGRTVNQYWINLSFPSVYLGNCNSNLHL